MTIVNTLEQDDMVEEFINAMNQKMMPKDESSKYSYDNDKVNDSENHYEPSASALQTINDLQMCIDLLKSKPNKDQKLSIDINIRIHNRIFNKKIKYEGEV